MVKTACFRMRPCIVFLMSYLYSCYNGFLLDDRTQPPTNGIPVLSEDHYSLLLNLLLEEKQSRIQLEAKVHNIQNELLATQESVTQNYHSIHKNNATQAANVGTVEVLNNSFLQLQHEHEMLRLELNQLKLNHTALQRYSAEVKRELDSIKQLQGVADLQTIMNIENKTNHLETEIQTTNIMLNHVYNDVDARKQDFLALFNKADQTQNELSNVTANFERQLSVIDARQNHSNSEMESRIQAHMVTIEKKQNSSSRYFQSELQKLLQDAYARQQDFLALNDKADKTQIQLTNITSKIEGHLTMIDARQNQSNLQLESRIQSQMDTLEKEQNSSTELFTSELNKFSNKVALTAGAKGGMHSVGSVILFSVIHTSYRLNELETASMKTTGKFTCKSSGMYLISAIIRTDIKNGATVLAFKNNDIIAYLYFSLNGNFQTSSITVLEKLTAGDNIYLMALSEMQIWSSQHSSITILQITNN